jgi:hypothetical protein
MATEVCTPPEHHRGKTMLRPVGLDQHLKHEVVVHGLLILET